MMKSELKKESSILKGLDEMKIHDDLKKSFGLVWNQSPNKNLNKRYSKKNSLQ